MLTAPFKGIEVHPLRQFATLRACHNGLVNEGELHYETIQTRARPARVAVLVNSSDPDWRATTLRVIEKLSSIWGGKHSLIVPTDGHSIDPLFWAILEKFSPDYVFSYRKTGSDFRVAKPQEYKDYLVSVVGQTCGNLPSDEQVRHLDEQLSKCQIDKFQLDSGLCSEITRRLVPFHFKSHIEPVSFDSTMRSLTSIKDVLAYGDRPNSFLSFQAPDIIEPIWWAGTTGKYSPEFVDELCGVGLAQEHQHVSNEKVGELASLVAEGRLQSSEALSQGATPFDLTMLRVALYGSAEQAINISSQFALILGDTLADFCLSYDLARVGYGAMWLPSSWITSTNTQGDPVLRRCLFSALHAIPYNPQISRELKVSSISERVESQLAHLEELKIQFGFGINDANPPVLTEASTLAISAVEPLIPYCVDTPNQRDIYPFRGNESEGPIRTPKPTGFSKLSATKHRWVTEISVDRKVIPTVPDIATHLMPLQQTVGTYATRVSRNSLVYTCPGSGLIISEDITPNIQHPTVRLFDTFTAIGSIAAERGFSCELSDKGIYQRDSLRKMGGLAEAANFLRQKSRGLFQKYLDHASRKPGVYDEGCVLDKRTYMDLTSAQKAIGGDEDAAVALLDRLAEMRVLYRGFILICTFCNHADWYRLNKISERFICSRCEREQPMRRQSWKHPASPQLFYKLDEMVYQFIHSDGDVVTLGLDHMSRNSKYPFDYSPEIKYRSKKDNTTGEIDICAVWDGELTIGEAKKAPKLADSSGEQNRIISKYKLMAAKVHARRVVFCTISLEWEASTVRAVRNAFQGEFAKPMFLQADELFSTSLRTSSTDN